MKSFLIIFLMITQFNFAQSKDPDEILKSVVKNFDRVKDYVVDVNIKVDVQSIKVPETTAKVYFKQPDKVHLESEGFAMLPKDGIQFSPSALLKKDYTALYEKDVDLNGVKTSIVKIIPSGDQSEIILSTLWIDQNKKHIRKVESTTKSNGTFTIDFTYDDKIKYPLPNQIVFYFNLDKMNLPTTNTRESNKDNFKRRQDFESTTKGKVIIKYSNYVVNKGVDDSKFEEKKN
jgi:outer membrane lipoprotein-sorting protein